MSCKFISELRCLSKLSAEAVQNVDSFDPMKKYLHVVRNTEKDFKSLMAKLIHKKRFVDDICVDKDLKVHLLRNQVVEKKDLGKILRRSGVDGVKRSLGEYAYTRLLSLLDIPLEISDNSNIRQALDASQSLEFILPLEINKETLSKGETQIFVMSLYWALMQQCKCELESI